VLENGVSKLNQRWVARPDCEHGLRIQWGLKMVHETGSWGGKMGSSALDSGKGRPTQIPKHC
jgi:hypothetical protein